jgi:NAD kinase
LHRVEAHKHHTGIIDSFKDLAREAGHEVVSKREDEVKDQDAENADLVVALGGDHTYLVAS